MLKTYRKNITIDTKKPDIAKKSTAVRTDSSCDGSHICPLRIFGILAALTKAPS
jgi:hypothetical protein